MLNPKTTIPKLLGATLTLTGCAVEADDTPAGSAWGASLEAFCMKLNTCDPTGTVVAWHYSFSECMARVEEINFVSQYFMNDECDALFASYYSCAAALSCDALRRPLGNLSLVSDELKACAELGEDETLALACYSMLPPF
jgi:hypothetical protein